jgi:hypothetical protein
MWFHLKGYNFQQKVNYHAFGGDLMETVDIELKDLEKWTSLEKAVEICNDQEAFLKYKRDKLYGAVDEEKQLPIFSDIRELMTKAAEGKFAEGDFERLESYRNLDSGALRFAPQLSKVFIPVEVYRDPDEQIKGIDLQRVDVELNKRLFQQVFDVLVGRKKVSVCAAEDCRKLFIPKGTGYEQIYHSSRCQVRVGVRKHRARKREQK